MSKSQYTTQIREHLVLINQKLSKAIEQNRACSASQKLAYYAQMGNLQRNLDAIENSALS